MSWDTRWAVDAADLKAIKDRQVNWRQADLHDLRTRYAALLLDIANHKAAHRWNQSDADRRLWAVLEQEDF